MTYVPDPIVEMYLIDPGTESDAWGDLLNINLRRGVESAHGITSKDVTGVTSWTLDDTDYTGTESHKKGIFLFGTMSANLDIFFPPGKQRTMRLFNNTESSDAGTPRTVTLKIAGGGGVAPYNTVPLVHGERISFMLREDGTFWPEFRSSLMLPTSGGALAGPLNANGQAITNLPHPAALNYNAAPVQWVADYIAAQIAVALTAERNRMYPVGTLYFNFATAANPATYLGFGTWVPWGGGTALVCAGIHTDTDGNAMNLSGASEKPPIGTFFSRLTQPNLPPITITTCNPGDNTGGFSFVEASGVGGLGSTTIALGTSAAFLNMMPISVVYVWRRVT